jgi:hypothetical protein
LVSCCHTRRGLLQSTALVAHEPQQYSHMSKDSSSLADSSQRLQEIVADTPNQKLRLSVDAGGCSGFQYKFTLEDGINDDDMCASSASPALASKQACCANGQAFEHTDSETRTWLSRHGVQHKRQASACEHECFTSQRHSKAGAWLPREPMLAFLCHQSQSRVPLEPCVCLLSRRLRMMSLLPRLCLCVHIRTQAHAIEASQCQNFRKGSKSQPEGMHWSIDHAHTRSVHWC